MSVNLGEVKMPLKAVLFLLIPIIGMTLATVIMTVIHVAQYING